ncbi:unnamed protein product [Lupinus luteus]|uniref:Purple acid phosphatase n=1 Tax=Lupinus luteus TaxID=3873 RepID=A0AAV1WLG6_LUPLU
MVASILAISLVLLSVLVCNGGLTGSYVRKPWSVDMPFDSDVYAVPSGYNAPQQVHITQGDQEGKAIIVSWVTVDEPGSNEVHYWTEGNPNSTKVAEGYHVTYRYFNYASGFIHHCLLKHLEYDTKYYYEVGIGHTVRQFHFMTPPEINPDAPYTFGLMGDLGQTVDSNSTLTHYESNPKKPQAVLFLGDLSYADDHPNHNNVRWDTWGRFTERSVAYQPWIWVTGNHELDLDPSIGEIVPFKPFIHRYPVPHKESGSTEPFWYSIKRASAHIIVLSSYSAYGKYTPQYQWLQAELAKVDRTRTPWLIVLVHAPWYNSYNYHYMEGETMRVQFESWFVNYKVDLVLSGHVHAYERTERISNIKYNIVDGSCRPVRDESAPVYITIGDGGNVEGAADNLIMPQPDYSAYREPSFGHAIFEIKNRTHAFYSWYRNDDDYATQADSMWFFNRYWHPVDDSTTSISQHY